VGLVSEPDAIDEVERPDALHVPVDPEIVEADRKDVRRGLVVAVVGLVLVGITGGLLNLGAVTAGEHPDQVADVGVDVQLPTFPLPEDDAVPTPAPTSTP
jgi:hypothetical protein